MKKIIVGLACTSLISFTMEKDSPDTQKPKSSKKKIVDTQSTPSSASTAVITFPQEHMSPELMEKNDSPDTQKPKSSKKKMVATQSTPSSSASAAVITFPQEHISPELMEKDDSPDTQKPESSKKKIVDTQSTPSSSASTAVITFPQVHMSPGLKDILIKLINDETKQLRGAFFRFTLYKAAQAIENGYKNKNVKASLIVDESNIKEDFTTPLHLIVKAGGSVYAKTKSRNGSTFESMHHKFMIFDQNIQNKKLIMTGSFNATGNANKNNCENIVILDDAPSIEKFETEFATVLKYSTPITDALNSKDKDPKASFGRTINDIPQLSEKIEYI